MILPGAKIGRNCNICAHVFIEDNVVVGDNVTIKNGVQLWNGLSVGDGVFIGPNVTFANDKFPRSKKYPQNFLTTSIGNMASIGANASILPGVAVGSGAMVGAGAVVTKDVPPNAVVMGNPGVISGYVDSKTRRVVSGVSLEKLDDEAPHNLGVGDAQLHILPGISDLRGSLSLVEYEKHIPFDIRRCFWVFDVPSREVRGEHAHKTLHQYLVCVKGSVSVVLDDAKSRIELVLARPNVGLHIPPLVWGVQYKYSRDAVLLVLASDTYDPSDYLRNYDEFLAYVAETRQKR